MAPDEVSWKSPTLQKGKAMRKDVGANYATMAHLDRTIDPYFASVMIAGRSAYTGLHAALADARSTCERILRAANV